MCCTVPNRTSIFHSSKILLELQKPLRVAECLLLSALPEDMGLGVAWLPAPTGQLTITVTLVSKDMLPCLASMDTAHTRCTYTHTGPYLHIKTRAKLKTL